MDPTTVALLVKLLDFGYMALVAHDNHTEAKASNDPLVSSLLDLKQRFTMGLITTQQFSQEADILITQIRAYRKAGESRL